MENYSENLKIRSKIICSVRKFFYDNGYLEVDTPIMGPAILPEAQIDHFCLTDDSETNLYLQASPELYMKRLIAENHNEDGCEKLFQICKCFRKGERSNTHLPEMTMLEWYGKNHTYMDLMNQCEKLLSHISLELNSSNFLNYQGKNIYFSNGCEKISVNEAFEKYAFISVDDALQTDMYDEIMAFEIEPNLGWDSPCFLFDYPSSCASLAALKPGSSSIAQRCELYIAGVEIANGFTELIDSSVQRQRFEKENLIRQDNGKSALPFPEKFIESLRKLPPCAGIALGLDRLVMLFLDSVTINSAVAFIPENQ